MWRSAAIFAGVLGAALAPAAAGAEPARRGGSAEIAGGVVADTVRAVPGLALVFGQTLPGMPAALEIEGTLALSARFATASARLVLGPAPADDGLAATLAGGLSFRADATVPSAEVGFRWRISAGSEGFTEGMSALTLEPAFQGPLTTPYPVLIWKSGADLWLAPRGAASAIGVGLRVEISRDGPLVGAALAFRGPASHVVGLLLEILRALVVTIA
jgi:hypothetical protein